MRNSLYRNLSRKKKIVEEKIDIFNDRSLKGAFVNWTCTKKCDFSVFSESCNQRPEEEGKRENS